MNIDILDIFSFAIMDTSIFNIKEYLEKQTVNEYRITYEEIDVEKLYFDNMYLQPIKGTAKGLFYNPDITPNLTIVLGNGRGSWGTLCNNISASLLVNNIQIEINSENSDTLRNRITVYDGKKTLRAVQRHLGDNKMEFVQSGIPLWFENTDYYKKRKIIDRINKNILIEYSQKIGFDIRNEICLHSGGKSLYVELGKNVVRPNVI
jgi:hypothetical protein